MFSSSKTYKLLYDQTRRSKGLGEERMELVVSDKKLFRGNPWLIRSQAARKFPTLKVNTGDFNPTSQLVILSGYRAGIEGTEQSIQRWKDCWGGTSTVIVLNDTFTSFFLPDTDESSGTVYASSTDNKPVWNQLAYQNDSIPFIFLVDSKGRLRWQSSGYPTPDEEKLLSKFKEQILE